MYTESLIDFCLKNIDFIVHLNVLSSKTIGFFDFRISFLIESVEEFLDSHGLFAVL